MCDVLNEADSKFCSKCGQILDVKVIKEIENTKNSAIEMMMKGGMKEQLITQLEEQIYQKIKKELGIKN
jgi:hypothetical protein